MITTTAAHTLVADHFHGFQRGVAATAPGKWLRAIFVDTARNNGVEPLDLAAATIDKFDAFDLDDLTAKVRAIFLELDQ